MAYPSRGCAFSYSLLSRAWIKFERQLGRQAIDTSEDYGIWSKLVHDEAKKKGFKTYAI
jgi:hypothetical protein